MNEAEWHAATEPFSMLEHVGGQASDRKLRLLACASCRLVWNWLSAESSRQAVKVAERYADGVATPEELRDAYERAARSCPPDLPLAISRRAVEEATEAAWLVAAADRESLLEVIDKVAEAAWQAAERHQEASAWNGMRARQAELVRYFLGNPFHPPTLDHSWVQTHARTALAVARAIDEELRFDALPILADALEEAGCEDPRVLQACRAAGPHRRGYWALDAVLGKD